MAQTAFQLPRLEFLMWRRDKSGVIAARPRHKGDWKPRCRPGSFCWCMVVLFFCFLFGTPHMSNSKFPIPKFKHHTSNRKHQIQSSPLRRSNQKVPKPISEFQIPESTIQTWNPQLGFDRFQIQMIEIPNFNKTGDP